MIPICLGPPGPLLNLIHFPKNPLSSRNPLFGLGSHIGFCQNSPDQSVWLTIYIYIYTHTYMHTYIYIYTYIYISTHILQLYNWCKYHMWQISPCLAITENPLYIFVWLYTLLEIHHVCPCVDYVPIKPYINALN